MKLEVKLQAIGSRLGKLGVVGFVGFLGFLMLMLFWRAWFGQVAVAFEYGLSHYQPWKIFYEASEFGEVKQLGHDDIRIFYPQRKLIVEALREGQILHWNPYEFAGNVFMANSQTAMFYPLFLVFLFLPLAKAWTLMAFLGPILAGTGLYLFVKEETGSELGAWVAGLSWAFSEVVVSRTMDGLVAGHSLAWIGFVLWGASLLVRKKRLVGTLVLLTSGVMAVLAGWFQFSFYSLFAGLIYVSYMSVRTRDRWLAVQFGVILVLVAGLTAFHWLPAYEALEYTPRGSLGTPVKFTQEHLMPVGQLVTVAIPHFFGHPANNSYYGASEYKEGVLSLGIVPLVLAAVAVLFLRKKDRLVGFGLLSAGLGLVLGVSNPLAKLVLALDLPVVSTFLPNRWLVFTALGLSVLAGVGASRLKNLDLEKLWRATVGVLAVPVGFYGLVAGLYFYEKFLDKLVGYSFFEHGIERYVRVSAKASLLPLVLVLAVVTTVFVIKKKKSKAKTWLPIVIVGLILVSGVYRASKYWYFSEAKYEFPDPGIFEFLQKNTSSDYSRVMSLDYSEIASNVPSFYGLYQVTGVDALYPNWYGEFSHFFAGVYPHKEDTPRIEARFSDAIGRKGWTTETYNLLSHLGVRYVVMPHKYHRLPPQEAFDRVANFGWHDVYEYKFAFPKAYFVGRARVSDRKALSLERIFHSQFYAGPHVVLFGEKEKLGLKKPELVADLDNNYDLQEIVFMVGEPDNSYDIVATAREGFGENPVEVVEYQEDRVVLRAETDKSGFVVVGDTYFPGWKAWVNGSPVEILRANYAFRAVEVPAGVSEIVMEFESPGFRQGVRISMISLGLVLVVGIGYWVVDQRST